MWERALDVSYTNPTTWLKYAEMEMRHRFINHARNVWDRAVSLLPRVDQLWYVHLLLPPLQSCTCSMPVLEECISTESNSSMHLLQHLHAYPHGQASIYYPGLMILLQVQVHPHGGDAGECAWRAANL